MRAKHQFLMTLYRRSGGRTDRTFHAYLHVAKPLALSHREMQHHLSRLVDEGMIETDPGFDRLIRLTHAGVAACMRAEADAAVWATAREVASASLFALPMTAGGGSAESTSVG